MFLPRAGPKGGLDFPGPLICHRLRRMQRPRALTFTAVAAIMLSATGFVSAAGASPSAVAMMPSAANAKRVTRLELMLRYQLLNPHATHHPVTLSIRCGRLAKRIYRCSYFGETSATDAYVYSLSGKSKVRFSASATHAALYGVSCNTYNLSDYIKYDFSC